MCLLTARAACTVPRRARAAELSVTSGPEAAPASGAVQLAAAFSTSAPVGTAQLRGYLRADPAGEASGGSVQLGPRFDLVLEAAAGVAVVGLSTEGFDWAAVDPSSVRAVLYIFPVGDDRAATRLATVVYPLNAPNLDDSAPATEAPATTTAAPPPGGGGGGHAVEILQAPAGIPADAPFSLLVGYTIGADRDPAAHTLRAYLRASDLAAGGSRQIGPRFDRDLGGVGRDGLVNVQLSAEGFDGWAEVSAPRAVVYVFPTGDDRTETRLAAVTLSLHPPTATTTTATTATATTATTTTAAVLAVELAPPRLPAAALFALMVRYRSLGPTASVTVTGRLLGTAANGSAVQVGPAATATLAEPAGSVMLTLTSVGFDHTHWIDPRAVVTAVVTAPSGRLGGTLPPAVHHFAPADEPSAGSTTTAAAGATTPAVPAADALELLAAPTVTPIVPSGDVPWTVRYAAVAPPGSAALRVLVVGVVADGAHRSTVALSAEHDTVLPAHRGELSGVVPTDPARLAAASDLRLVMCVLLYCCAVGSACISNRLSARRHTAL